MATRCNITAGDWHYEPLDPGHSGSWEEPPEPSSPAFVYALQRDVDEKLGEMVEYEVPICQLESPVYHRLVKKDSDYDRFDPPPMEGTAAKDRGFVWEPVVLGDESANARFLAAAPSMWRALNSVRNAMLLTVDNDERQIPMREWRGPWAGVFNAVDGAIKRCEGVEGYEQHTGCTVEMAQKENHE